MKNVSLILVSIALFFLHENGHSQKNSGGNETEFEVQVTHAQFLGKTPPLRNLVPLQGITPEKRTAAEKMKMQVPNFAGRKMPSGEVDPKALPKGEDPVLQKSFDRTAADPLEPLVIVEGMDQSTALGVNPPDVCGDIGANFFIQMVNSSFFQVFDKSGNPVSNPIGTGTLWSQVGESSAGDPIILYDQEAQRWIITEFASMDFLLLFAISETSDPFGSWDAFAFPTPLFPDYPKYSIWPNAYCVTTNEQDPGTLVNYFINREEILNGEENPTIQRITTTGIFGEPSFIVSTPVDWTGSTPPPADAKPMTLRLDDDGWGSNYTDGITFFEFDIDWSDEDNTSVVESFTPTAPFNTAACAEEGNGFACIPQLNGPGIDGIPDIIMHQAHYRNFESHETLVLNFLVNADGTPIRAGIRWMELRRSDGGDWTVYQEGTFAPNDDLHRFMGGIAMDGNGNIGLGYSFSGYNDHPGIGFTARKVSDPLGVMSVEEYIITEGFSVNNSDRYGDYSQMVVDPSNDRTFWYTGEYRKSGGWGTKIFSFELERDNYDLGPIALEAPLNAPDLTNMETVTVTVKNYGIESLSNFEIGYVFENGAPVIEPVNITLSSDETYTHTFSETVDMSTVGDYQFTLFTKLSGDELPLNDTLRLVRERLPRFDAGISNIEGLEGQPCGEEIPATVKLQNFGTETLTSATIEITLNNVLVETLNWTGSLSPGASEFIDIVLTGILDGTNNVVATTSSPNGMVDEAPINDSFSRDFNALANGVIVKLQLLTDDYPGETTWELTDESGLVVSSGGPYGNSGTLFTTEWCLQPNECYEFTIFDTANDGICCSYGEGNYSIVNENGEVIVASTGEFLTMETFEFCANTANCQMTADIAITNVSMPGGSNGVILISPLNGVGPYMYSIDGGANFQAENIFDNLTSGEYEIIVMGEGDCYYEETIILAECAILFSVEITPESKSNAFDGAISILAFNGNGALSYSVDGGEVFQPSPVFPNLGTGDYEVVIVDELGCSATATVFVDIVNEVGEVFSDIVVTATPNPTDGVFQLSVQGLEIENVLLPVKIYDASGKLIQSKRIGKFDKIYTGQISLVAFPSGTYFVRFELDGFDKLFKVVKH